MTPMAPTRVTRVTDDADDTDGTDAHLLVRRVASAGRDHPAEDLPKLKGRDVPVAVEVEETERLQQRLARLALAHQLTELALRNDV